MPLILSAALDRITPSPTLAMTSRTLELQAQGIKVIGLAAGEPDFDTPDFVKEAAIEAIRAGQDQIYQCRWHAPSSRPQSSPNFKRDNKLSLRRPQQISVNVGRQAHLVQRAGRDRRGG